MNRALTLFRYKFYSWLKKNDQIRAYLSLMMAFPWEKPSDLGNHQEEFSVYVPICRAVCLKILHKDWYLLNKINICIAEPRKFKNGHLLSFPRHRQWTVMKDSLRRLRRTLTTEFSWRCPLSVACLCAWATKQANSIKAKALSFRIF